MGRVTLVELKGGYLYRRFLLLTIAAGCALTASNAVAASERVRGTVASVSGDTLIVDTVAGQIVPVTLTDGTRYLKLAPSSLNHVDPAAYIDTVTKSIGDQLIALEVTVFPPSVKGMGEGHYAWDRIRDTTLSGVGTAPSAMTNGTVSAVSAAQTVDSTMTNGTVSSFAGSGGAKRIVVIYKGGKQVILVPPTAPIVTYQLGQKAELKPGTAVFINAESHDGTVTANAVAVGIDGVKPPSERESLLSVRPRRDLPSRKPPLRKSRSIRREGYESWTRFKHAAVRLTLCQSESCTGSAPPLSSACF